MRVRGVRRRDVEGERMLCGSDLQNQIGVVQNVGCAASRVVTCVDVGGGALRVYRIMSP